MATNLRQTLDQMGWQNAALYWLGRVLARASAGRWRIHRYHFVAQRLDDAPLAGARGRDIEIHPHDPHTALPPGYPRAARVVAARHAQGASSHAGNPTPLMMAALAYVVVFLPLVVASRWLERHWGRR